MIHGSSDFGSFFRCADDPKETYLNKVTVTGKRKSRLGAGGGQGGVRGSWMHPRNVP